MYMLMIFHQLVQMIADILKKLILSILGLMAFATVHAQQTVVIQRPGILTDLAEAAGAIAALPLALAEGLVVGTAEAAGSLLHGSTQVVVAPAPVAVQPQVVVAPAPVAVQPQVVVAPVPVAVQPQVVVAPAPVAVQPRVVAPAPVVVQPRVVAPAPMTTITTVHRDGTTVSVTRPASAYELGSTVIAPVDPDHRVGSSPFVNPYVFRYR